jgi:hypothetical protein
MELDKITPHSCKGVKNVQTIQELPQTPVQKRIDELALMKIASFDKIAAALERNNNQNVADAIFYLAESITEMSKAIKALTQVKVET